MCVCVCVTVWATTYEIVDKKFMLDFDVNLDKGFAQQTQRHICMHKHNKNITYPHAQVKIGNHLCFGTAIVFQVADPYV